MRERERKGARDSSNLELSNLLILNLNGFNSETPIRLHNFETQTTLSDYKNYFISQIKKIIC